MRARGHDRIAWAALAAASAGVLLIARLLTPSASGVGTHTQLGLPPCGFLVTLGVPCPACGLTTAFAHLAHGDVGASLAAHPLGLPLFAGLAVIALHAAIAGVRGRPIVVPERAGQLAWLYVAALLVVWMLRLGSPLPPERVREREHSARHAAQRTMLGRIQRHGGRQLVRSAARGGCTEDCARTEQPAACLAP